MSWADQWSVWRVDDVKREATEVNPAPLTRVAAINAARELNRQMRAANGVLRFMALPAGGSPFDD